MFASANLPPLPPRLNLRFAGVPVAALSRLVALLETSYVVVLVVLLPHLVPRRRSSSPSSSPFLLLLSLLLSSVAATATLVVYLHVRYLIRHSLRQRNFLRCINCSLSRRPRRHQRETAFTSLAGGCALKPSRLTSVWRVSFETSLGLKLSQGLYVRRLRV